MNCTADLSDHLDLTTLPGGVKISARGVCPCCGRRISLRTISPAQHAAMRAPRNDGPLTRLDRLVANLSILSEFDDFFATGRSSAKSRNTRDFFV